MKSNLSKLLESLVLEKQPGLPPSNALLFHLNSSSFPLNANAGNTSLDPPSSYDPYQHVTEIIVYKYICLSIFVFGMIGNFLSVLVFSRSSLRHRSCAVYFLALAITDVASLCASFVDTVLPSYNNLTLTIKSLLICKINPLMVYFTTDLSNFLLAVASIDRAVSIQCPLTSKRFCRADIAIGLILLMSLIFLGINGHIFWGFEIVEEAHFPVCMPSKSKVIWGHSMTYNRFYAIFDSLDMLFAVVIPFLVMLICNVLILVRVLTSRRSIRAIVTTTMQSKRSRKRHEKEKQLTVMLLGSAAGQFFALRIRRQRLRLSSSIFSLHIANGDQ